MAMVSPPPPLPPPPPDPSKPPHSRPRWNPVVAILYALSLKPAAFFVAWFSVIFAQLLLSASSSLLAAFNSSVAIALLENPSIVVALERLLFACLPVSAAAPPLAGQHREENGNFKESLVSDAKGMLSLYEASFLGYEGEKILDEAIVFSRFHLRVSLNEGKSSNMLLENKSIMHWSFHSITESKGWKLDESLPRAFLPEKHLPLLTSTRMIIARTRRIHIYRQHNGNARLRRPCTQVEELEYSSAATSGDVLTVLKRERSREWWWREMGLASKLSFSRDRLMECFFWTVGMVFEPQFSDLRKGLTKVTSLITTIDDVYDVYGTLDELELFTAAVERIFFFLFQLDVKAVQVLPDYMKICFLALYNTVNEFAYDALRNMDKIFYPTSPKQCWSDMLKAFPQEAKWSRDRHLPRFEDYINNAWVSVSGVVILTHAYFLLNQSITKEALQSLHNYHSLLQKPSLIFRLCNDLGTSKAELERGEAASSIVCFMRESGASEEGAYKHIHTLLDETWKKMNKDRVSQSPFPKAFVETAMNLGRISRCTYQYGDGHGAPDSTAKNRIRSLIIEPVRRHFNKLFININGHLGKEK
ncbi:hypothetical protein LR48_Vigan08g127100 [Vigna angularis]|uniref:Terpene synthase metal-binding domain-containing protein n=1 Tax=Phaseolus angularis TaxID=3914 RepID=A0A0L9V725_PHAAN|nr:hypothetical protein LR48_Vigan08g127100 [Vigna angularis]